MYEDQVNLPRQISLPSLIAWLSLCMLAAAWGHTVDERWQKNWAIAGTFGIVAATGLGSLEKVRLVRNKFLRERTVRLLSEKRLAQFNEHNAALESIDKAIHRLTTHAASERRKRNFKSTQSKGTAVLSKYPLKVIPIGEHDDVIDVCSARSIVGSLHKISPSVISFEHDETFTERIVLLAFKLEAEKQLCFVVNVMYTQKFTDGFTSSGAVVAAGISDRKVSESNQAASVEKTWPLVGNL